VSSVDEKWEANVQDFFRASKVKLNLSTPDFEISEEKDYKLVRQLGVFDRKVMASMEDECLFNLRLKRWNETHPTSGYQ